MRNAFGNRASLITPAQVARNRAAAKDRKTPWSVAELEASLPKMLVIDGAWKLTASHNAATAPNALTIQPWSSGQPQQSGMWFQVELPQAAQVTQIQFESPGVPESAAPAVLGAPTRTGQLGTVGPPGFPRGYQVQVSMDGSTWGSAVAQGEGTGANLDITFVPVRAKYIRITQTGGGEALPPWSIRRLRLYQPGASASASR